MEYKLNPTRGPSTSIDVIPPIFIFPPAVNVAFSSAGLKKILPAGCDIKDIGDKPFLDGQLDRAESELGDNLTTWLPEYKERIIDGVFIVTGCNKGNVDLGIRDLETALGSSIDKVFQWDCSVRPGDLCKLNHCA